MTIKVEEAIWVIDGVLATAGGGTPGGADTQVQFNDGGSFGGDTALIWDKTNNYLKLLADNAKLYLGAGVDASLYYDGTNLIIDPKEVGTGVVSFAGSLKANQASVVSSGTYSIAYGGNGGAGMYDITSSGFGTMAFGFVVGADGGTGHIISSSNGSIAMGYSNGYNSEGTLQSTSSGSIALGNVTSDSANGTL